MVVILSIPSIKRAVRVLRSTKSNAPSAACKPKCMAPLTMNRERSPRRTTCRTFRIPGALISTAAPDRSEEHTSELQSHSDLVCRLLLEKKKKNRYNNHDFRDQGDAY